MNVKSVENKENSAVEIVIEVGKEQFEAALDKAYKKQRGSIALPGFRKGKAPRKMIESMYGTGVFYEDAMNDIYPTAYAEAVEESGLDVVSFPSVEIMDASHEGFTFKVTVTVRPVAKIEGYKGLSAVKEDTKIDEADVDAEMKPFINKATRMVTVERAAQNGDTVVLDFEGFDENGVAFGGGKGENHDLVLGSNSFIPGFEEQLVGMTAGQEGEVKVTFPADYHANELADKPVVFKVKVHEVKEACVPELDDEFAKDVSEFDTLADLKADLTAKLTVRREAAVKQAFEEALMEQLVELMEVEIPEPMVEYQAEKMVDDYAMRISMQGIEFEQYLKMVGLTRQDMTAQAHDSALMQVKAQLALEAVAAAEGIVLTAEDVEAEYARMAEEYKMELDQVKRAVAESTLKEELLRIRAMAVVVDSAKATKPKKTTAKKTTKKADETTEAAGEEKPKKAAAKKPAAKKATPKKTAAKKETTEE